ncbi:MAG: UxaA family hydrolase [Candidatus Thermoplasmatota archaeon]|jgi:altronate hydrolase|nr:UxaA family hydrolase [Candidatus Thermoplasmatota archaeon]
MSGEMLERQKILLLSVADNVAVAIVPIKKGDVLEIDGKKIGAMDDIDFGHKIALREIKKDDNVIKYGEIIGVAKEKIPAGSHVHVHNVKSLRADRHE